MKSIQPPLRSLCTASGSCNPRDARNPCNAPDAGDGGKPRRGAKACKRPSQPFELAAACFGGRREKRADGLQGRRICRARPRQGAGRVPRADGPEIACGAVLSRQLLLRISGARPRPLHAGAFRKRASLRRACSPFCCKRGPARRRLRGRSACCRCFRLRARVVGACGGRCRALQTEERKRVVIAVAALQAHVQMRGCRRPVPACGEKGELLAGRDPFPFLHACVLHGHEGDAAPVVHLHGNRPHSRAGASTVCADVSRGDVAHERHRAVDGRADARARIRRYVHSPMGVGRAGELVVF